MLFRSNAMASAALSELALILEEKKYSDYARKIIERFSHDAILNPMSYLSLMVSDLVWKPVKKKPEPVPEPKPVPTDEELNREEPQPQPEQPQPEHEDRRTLRNRTRSNSRTERTERRRGARTTRAR